MKQVAIYGKGGIGKSTTSANISYVLSKNGLKVAQIGCDPKHDSTRLLLGGKVQTTVLDHISQGSKEEDDTVTVGKNGVLCIETGGPEPGVGCAGRGILTAFDFIKQKDLISADTDIVIYDVLGDVVCGGFAVPLRKQYANIVFIVTSGEFMSLYAANNVLKGIRNFDNGDRRLAGLILNERGNENEYEYVKNFADAVELPIVVVIPRSKRFSVAEANGMTVCEMFPDSEEAKSYGPLLDKLTAALKDDTELYEARPLDDDDLDMIAKGLKVNRRNKGDNKSRTLAVDERSTLKGCGIRASARCCMNILDAEIIAHGPMSCAYFYGNVYDRELLYEGKTDIASINTRLFPTNLDDNASIFGGGPALKEKLEERIAQGAKLLFITPACVPGIIGDDTENIGAAVEKEHPGVRIITIPMDGILCGGGVQGHDMAIERICTLIDKSVEPVPGTVNILGYHDTDDRVLDACDDMDRILDAVDLKVNCLFLHENTSDEVINARRGALNIMYGQSTSLRREAKIIKRCADIDYYPMHMPRGLEQTIAWVKEMASMRGLDTSKSDGFCDGLKKEYDESMSSLRRKDDDASAIIYTESSGDVEWLIETLQSLNIKVLKILCPVNSVWSLTDDSLATKSNVPIGYGVNLDGLEKEVETLKPTFVIGSSGILSFVKSPHIWVERPRPGIRGCIEQAKRITRMLEVNGLVFD